MFVDGEAVTLPVDVKVNAAAIARERKGGGAPDILRATAAEDRGGKGFDLRLVTHFVLVGLLQQC